MEKKRWSLIFIGLCLALVFSVSPVEAEIHHDCTLCAHCDRDGDGDIKDTPPCIANCVDVIRPEDRPDIDDDDGDAVGMCDESGGGAAKIQICHFKYPIKHCLELGVDTGGEREIRTDAASIARHMEHGDCSEFTNAPGGCANHCICLSPGINLD